MPPTRYQIQHVAVDEGTLQIGYFDPNVDMKAPGLVRLHTLIVPKGDDYDDEIDAVLDALVYLLNDVAEDWDNLPAPRPLAAMEGEQEDEE
jgi:hypothetical protein